MPLRLILEDAGNLIWSKETKGKREELAEMLKSLSEVTDVAVNVLVDLLLHLRRIGVEDKKGIVYKVRLEKCLT